MASIVNPGCIVPGVAGMTWPRLLTLDASCRVLQGDMASIVNPGCIVPGVAGMTWPRLLTLDASCRVLQGCHGLDC